MMYGWVESASGEILDEVLAVFLPGPHSYTREDVSGFNRQFLRAYKIPPRRYRLMHRAK